LPEKVLLRLLGGNDVQKRETESFVTTPFAPEWYRNAQEIRQKVFRDDFGTKSGRFSH
jgi:hypothetical protein